MSLRSDRLAPEPGYASTFLPARAAFSRAGNYQICREAKRFPAVVISRHRQPPCSDADNDAKAVGGVRQDIRETRRVVVPSPVFREEPMQDIAHELQQIVFRAAGEIRPGMSIKAQINAACENLGYARGNWRVREAWYGEASNWRGQAIFDLIGRYNRLLERQRVAAPPANDGLPALRMVASDKT